MTFMTSTPPRQLAFPFIEREPPPASCSRSTVYWRKRLAAVARKAIELGRRQRKPVVRPRSLSAAAAPVVVRMVYPSPSDRNELSELANRVARLSISRRDPESFFVEKRDRGRTAPHCQAIALKSHAKALCY
jgi:hypothetical protein